MKQLYIRKGNLEENRNILIIGEEADLGSRDSAYKPKGTLHQRLPRDPYTGAENLAYIHACKNILLISSQYKNDHAVHDFVKRFCKDLVVWDGESNQGLTNSREAFICKSKNVDKTVRILRKRIQAVVKPEGFKQFLQKIYYSLKVKKKIKSKRKARNIKLWLVIILITVLNFHPVTKPFVRKVETIIYNTISKLFN